MYYRCKDWGTPGECQLYWRLPDRIEEHVRCQQCWGLPQACCGAGRLPLASVSPPSRLRWPAPGSAGSRSRPLHCSQQQPGVLRQDTGHRLHWGVCMNVSYILWSIQLFTIALFSLNDGVRIFSWKSCIVMVENIHLVLEWLKYYKFIINWWKQTTTRNLNANDPAVAYNHREILEIDWGGEGWGDGPSTNQSCPYKTVCTVWSLEAGEASQHPLPRWDVCVKIRF